MERMGGCVRVVWLWMIQELALHSYFVRDAYCDTSKNVFQIKAKEGEKWIILLSLSRGLQRNGNKKPIHISMSGLLAF